jgi:hypothetical protein
VPRRGTSRQQNSSSGCLDKSGCIDNQSTYLYM